MIFNESMTIMQGVQLTIISMCIVFILLYLISLILTLFKHIPNGDNNAKKEVVAAPPKVEINKFKFSDIEDDEEAIVAALVATIDASEGKKESNYRVTKITRI